MHAAKHRSIDYMYILYTMHRIIGYILVWCWCTPNAASSNATPKQKKQYQHQTLSLMRPDIRIDIPEEKNNNIKTDTTQMYLGTIVYTAHYMQICTSVQSKTECLLCHRHIRHQTEKFRVNGPNRCQDYRGCHHRVRAHCTTRGKQKHRKHNAKQEHIPQIVMQDV